MMSDGLDLTGERSPILRKTIWEGSFCKCLK